MMLDFCTGALPWKKAFDSNKASLGEDYMCLENTRFQLVKMKKEFREDQFPEFDKQYPTELKKVSRVFLCPE